jgi:Na+/glutamate symporter
MTGLEASGIAVALFVATTLVALAFKDTAKRARAVGTVSMYVTVAWVAVAFVIVFHVLWIVFLLAVVAIWPLRTVTPK